MDFTKVQRELERRGYRVTVCPDAASAAAYLNAEIDGTSVGFGGSVTLRELGLIESLGAHNEVVSHWDVPEGRTTEEVRHDAMRCEAYLTSANGLAETGEIINIDGTGNRVAATLYGHERVFFVIGRNKLAPTYDEALWRARNVAAPKNAQRLARRTPCAIRADRCYDCRSPERICHGLVVLWEAMKGSRTEVVLVDADLGY